MASILVNKSPAIDSFIDFGNNPVLAFHRSDYTSPYTKISMSTKFFSIDVSNRILNQLPPPVQSNQLPVVLTVAGSDSSGGAGIEADLKTMTAHQCYGMTTITKLTAQNTRGVLDTLDIPYDFLVKMLDQNFSDIDISVIKTGVLTKNAVLALKFILRKYKFDRHLVIDPIMISTSGHSLSKQEDINCLVTELFEFATLITPNMIEAKVLLSILDSTIDHDQVKITTLDDIYEMCIKIHKLTLVENILIKGGHQKWHGKDEYLLTDVLYECKLDKFTVFRSEMLNSKNTHGTGCTLSSAISCNFALGYSIVDSVANGIFYVQQGIKTAPNLGHGSGPLNHVSQLERLKALEYEPKIIDYQLPFEKGGFLKYLISHPDIKPHWDMYINHKFVKKVSDLSLPLENFNEYVKQDYPYLINYAKVHSIASSLAPDINSINDEAKILLTIVAETKKHEQKLFKMGMDSNDIANIRPNQACTNYIEYLMNLGKHKDNWPEIQIALAPCLHGYARASSIVSHEFQNIDISKREQAFKCELYKNWLDDYTSEWYRDACIQGEKVLDDLCFNSGPIDELRLNRLIQIFKDVTLLEIDFWNTFV